MAIEWMRLEELVGKEVAIDYLKRTKGEAQAFLPVTIRSCEGDLILAVNALVDYQEHVDWAKKQGITADGARPEEPATRAEVWAMLHEYDKQKK